MRPACPGGSSSHHSHCRPRTQPGTQAGTPGQDTHLHPEPGTHPGQRRRPGSGADKAAQGSRALRSHRALGVQAPSFNQAATAPWNLQARAVGHPEGWSQQRGPRSAHTAHRPPDLIRGRPRGPNAGTRDTQETHSGSASASGSRAASPAFSGPEVALAKGSLILGTFSWRDIKAVH